jgi:hypothetical protein
MKENGMKENETQTQFFESVYFTIINYTSQVIFITLFRTLFDLTTEASHSSQMSHSPLTDTDGVG